jgi:hypothetical protein
MQAKGFLKIRNILFFEGGKNATENEKENEKENEGKSNK